MVYLIGTHRKQLWGSLGSDTRRRENQYRGVFTGNYWVVRAWFHWYLLRRRQIPPRIAAWWCKAGVCLLWLPTHVMFEDFCSFHFWAVLTLLNWELPGHQGRSQAGKQKDTPGISQGGSYWSRTKWVWTHAETVHCSWGWNQRLGVCGDLKDGLIYSFRKRVYWTATHLKHSGNQWGTW